MLDKMYKVAVVLDNSSIQDLFVKEFPYLKKAILTEEALIKLEHYGKFPTLNEFHHSLLEISKSSILSFIKCPEFPFCTRPYGPARWATATTAWSPRAWP